jgi:hypothetical protein
MGVSLDCLAGMEMRKLVEMLAETGLTLFLEHFFDLPDLFFNFTSVAFGFTFQLLALDCS